MAAQFDVWRIDGGPLVIVIQNDIHSEMPTRVVAPLAAWSQADAYRHLTPKLRIDDQDYMIETHTLATLRTAELGTFVTNAAHARNDITRAIDTILSGI